MYQCESDGTFQQCTYRKRSQGHGLYYKPKIHDASFYSLISDVNTLLGLHHIRTKLYSVSLKIIHDLHKKAKNKLRRMNNRTPETSESPKTFIGQVS